jgi:hypothetical protein
VDQRYDDALSLTYTTETLPEDVELTGDPKVVLYVSSTADTAYFHAKISDVAPDGTVKWVTDGGLLASHRNSHASPEPLEPGKIYEVRPDMKYMAYVFPKGHRIRISVASADFQNAWPVGKKAVNTIHRGGERASHVILPIVPAQNPKLPEVHFLPSPRDTPTDESIPKATHTITHDLVNGTVTVRLENFRSVEMAEDGRMGSQETSTSSYTVSKNNPADAELQARHEYVVVGPDGDIKVEANEVVSSDVSSFRYMTDVHITVGGKPHFQKSWRVSVPRKLN